MTIGGRGRRQIVGGPSRRNSGFAPNGGSGLAIAGRGSFGSANGGSIIVGCPVGGGLPGARPQGASVGSGGSAAGSRGGSINAPAPSMVATQVLNEPCLSAAPAIDCGPPAVPSSMGGNATSHAHPHPAGHGFGSLAAAAAAATAAATAVVVPPVPPLPSVAAAAAATAGPVQTAGTDYTMRGLPSDSSYTDSSDDESSTGSSSASESPPRKRPVASLCAVFGDGPLKKIPGVGWYFRLRIDSVCVGWVGGFAIGVTMTHPLSLSCLPDRAARVPRSWIAGYWGRTFANGQERFCSWRPQTLRLGDEVAFFVGLEGECIVFVNNEETCRFADPPVPVRAAGNAAGGVAGGAPGVELTPLLDLSATAASITFLNGAPPPPSVCPGGVPPSLEDAVDDGVSPPPPSPRVSEPAPHIRPPQGVSPATDTSPASRSRNGTRPPPVPPLLQLRANGGLGACVPLNSVSGAAVPTAGPGTASPAPPSVAGANVPAGTPEVPGHSVVKAPRHIPKLALGSIR